MTLDRSLLQLVVPLSFLWYSRSPLTLSKSIVAPIDSSFLRPYPACRPAMSTLSYRVLGRGSSRVVYRSFTGTVQSIGTVKSWTASPPISRLSPSHVDAVLPCTRTRIKSGSLQVVYRYCTKYWNSEELDRILLYLLYYAIFSKYFKIAQTNTINFPLHTCRLPTSVRRCLGSCMSPMHLCTVSRTQNRRPAAQ